MGTKRPEPPPVQTPEERKRQQKLTSPPPPPRKTLEGIIVSIAPDIIDEWEKRARQANRLASHYGPDLIQTLDDHYRRQHGMEV